MATKTFLTTETQDTKGGKYYTISEAPAQEDVSFSDGVTLDDTVTGEAVVISEAVTVDIIGIVDTIDFGEISACQPIGGGTLPVIALQQADWDGETEGTYQTIYSHTFTEGGETGDFERSRWKPEKLYFGGTSHKMMQGGRLREYPYVWMLHFEIDWRNPFCNTALLKFLYQFALDWHGVKRDNYRRRIVLFPSGSAQTDFYGNTCKGIQVKIVNKDFWVRLKDLDGRRGGGYEGTLKLDTDWYYPGESPFNNYSTTDSIFVGLDEWQDILPWGTVFGE